MTSTAAAITQAQAEQPRLRQRRQVTPAAQKQMWLESGDPILEKEAQIWFQAQVKSQNTDRSES